MTGQMPWRWCFCLHRPARRWLQRSFLGSSAPGSRPQSSALLRPLFAAAVKEPLGGCSRPSGCGATGSGKGWTALAAGRASLRADVVLGNRLYALAISVRSWRHAGRYLPFRCAPLVLDGVCGAVGWRVPLVPCAEAWLPLDFPFFTPLQRAPEADRVSTLCPRRAGTGC